mmetsp:Transcript_17792/g.26488  ORF Transcript_17792/g.26488 Transcript_17792/m.26488 type:complete len:94 (-) Transcript_17792:707-988(-)
MSQKQESIEKERDWHDPNVCRVLKELHDACFYQWYNEQFLVGKVVDEDPCKVEWFHYQQCVKQRLKAIGLESLIPSEQSDQSSAEKTTSKAES